MTQVAEGVYFIEGQDDMIPDSHVYIIGKPGSEDFFHDRCGACGEGPVQT